MIKDPVAISSLPESVKEWISQCKTDLQFWLNGKKVTVNNPDPNLPLVDFLHLSGLTGTKIGCGEGGCGACTVMLSDRTDSGINHKAINSCLRPIVSVADLEITTVEGIGSVREGLDPVQHRLSVYNGSQCGYCTPGFVMNMHSFLQQNKSATQEEIEDLFGGNLCRCTGYRPILHAMKTFACDYDANKDCTKPCQVDPFFTFNVRDEHIEAGANLPRPLEPLYFNKNDIHWFRPLNLKDAQMLKSVLERDYGKSQVKLIVGNTASGIYPSEKSRFLIDISNIKELERITDKEDSIEVGAAVSIQTFVEYLESSFEHKEDYAITGLKELVRHSKFIAGIQVRNAGSIGGNIFITKSHTKSGHFPSDLFTIMAALGSTVKIRSTSFEGNEKIFSLDDMPIAEEFPKDGILVSFEIPYTKKREYVQTFRIARRPQMSHPIVNAGLRVHLNEDNTIKNCAIVFGGIAACNSHLTKTESWLDGKSFNEDTLNSALKHLQSEIEETIITMDEEGFTNQYREQLALNFFYKFFLHVSNEINPDSISDSNHSACNHVQRPVSSGMQTFDSDPSEAPLTQPLAKGWSFSQATGEIRYTHDESLPPGGLNAALVLSTRPHAKFEFTNLADGIAKTEELLKEKFPGFESLVTARDIPEDGINLIGMGKDDPIFCDGVATCVGAPICLVLAEEWTTAKAAAEFVSEHCISYTDLPFIATLEDAIEKQSLMPESAGKEKEPDSKHIELVRKDSDLDWLQNPEKTKDGEYSLSGSFYSGAQAHFYMETMSALAVPGYEHMVVVLSTQNPNNHQTQIAKALGYKSNQVTIKVTQLGGGFGGKQHRAVFAGAMTAIAAQKLNRPVKIIYTRHVDMQSVGKRHPYSSNYNISYSKDGKLSGASLELRSEGGNTIDCSLAVIKGSVMMSDGCYKIPTFKSTGTVFKTNKASNTAMRTFGQVQPHLVLEDAIEHVAFDLSKKTGKRVLPEEIRRKNLYKSAQYDDADQTHFGQSLWYCDLKEQWDKMYKEAEFEERLKQVDKFNAENKWRKRGISMIPLKYGIGFKQFAALNSSSALVHINREDGSVMVIHGGVEMGQGLHIKIAQLASNELNIPLKYIRVLSNNSDVIVNAPATAASTGFDLNGGAVAMACRSLKGRLEKVCEELKNREPDLGDLKSQWREKWPLIVHHGWMQGVSLASDELYSAPHYDKPIDNYEQRKFFAYFTYSYSIAEVEIDVLTGEFSVLRADLLYDAGRSPNPAIDIGQIEGGFVQGLGFVTTEECVYDDEGRLVTDNIWSYKPPCSKTIPIDLRVKLIPRDATSCAKQEEAGLMAIRASKSTSEPSLSLGNSVYFAIKHAIQAARAEQTGVNEWFQLDVPLTCQRIQSSCMVDFDKLNLGKSK